MPKKTAVKEQNKGAECYLHLLVPYPADNSDSPPVVEQSQQGHSTQLQFFIDSLLRLFGVSYALCLSASPLQCGYVL